MTLIGRALAASLALATVAAAQARKPISLPAPTGPAAIGRASFDWVDSSRAAFLDTTVAARRELVVDVWYPSAGSSRGADYLPNLSAIRGAMADSVARRRFAPAYGAIEAGLLSTHASEGAPVRCPSGGCPLLTFSHGGGMDRSFYTAQYEDLSSHGYIVAAIAHTGDTHRVVFGNGRTQGAYAPPPPAPDLPEWRNLPSLRRGFLRSEANANYGRRVLAVEAADIRFVVTRMAQLSRTLGSPFAGAVDTSRIGALGHSAGGMAAARACQRDPRIKACLNQDGAMGNLPFDRDAKGRTMNQPFMYLTRPYNRPAESDSLIAQLQTTRAELKAHLDWIQFRPDSLFNEMPSAWRATIRLPGITHMGFSDEPLLFADGDSTKTRRAHDWLRVVTVYTRAFFDKVLRGDSTTVLDRGDAGESGSVKLERFARRPSLP